MLFFTDLDNTVIYSKRHKKEEPLIWVEYLKGQPQSYMSQKAYAYYKKQNWLEILPITTRTYLQYSRLQEALFTLGWENALICNGSILLEKGKEDPEWTRESRKLAEKDQAAYEEAVKIAEDLAGKEALIRTDPFLFYVKTKEPERIYRQLLEQTEKEHLLLTRDARKVYCCPASLNKGRAAERYRQRRGLSSYMAAGDSEFDIPLLKEAEICLCPEEISAFEAKGQKRILRGNFADRICEELEKMKRERDF